MKAVYNIGLLMLLPLLSAAQYEETGWNQAFRESGKIYVVVAVVLLILLTVFVYLIIQDRRIARLEKSIKGDNQ